jgi:hypothetical protein
MVEARLASMSRRKEGFVIRSLEQAADTTVYTSRAMLLLRININPKNKLYSNKNRNAERFCPFFCQYVVARISTVLI